MTITPSGGFNSTVNLTCAIAPAAALPPKCSFSSAIVSGGSGTPTLTVSTVASTASVRPNGAVGYVLRHAVTAVRADAAGSKVQIAKQEPLGWLLICLVFSGLVWLAACGGGSSGSTGGGGGTTAGSYTVTVTGTSGALVQTQTLAVTVQ